MPASLTDVEFIKKLETRIENIFLRLVDLDRGKSALCALKSDLRRKQSTKEPLSEEDELQLASLDLKLENMNMKVKQLLCENDEIASTIEATRRNKKNKNQDEKDEWKVSIEVHL